MKHPDLTALRFYLGRQTRSRRWLIAYVLFLAIFLAGVFWGKDKHGTFSYGFMGAVIIGLHFYVAQDRMSGFDKFLYSFLSPGRVLLCKIAVQVFWCASLFVLAAIAGSIVWREPAYAIWSATRLLLFVWAVFPLALLLELIIGITIPALVAILVVNLAVTTAVIKSSNVARAVDLFGIEMTPNSYSSLGRFLLVSTLWNAVFAVVIIGIFAFQNRPRHVRPAR